jgi:hypothetical protein
MVVEVGCSSVTILSGCFAFDVVKPRTTHPHVSKNPHALFSNLFWVYAFNTLKRATKKREVWREYNPDLWPAYYKCWHHRDGFTQAQALLNAPLVVE